MIVVAHGAQAVEQALLDRVDALLSSGELDPPLRIIVPSQSLRQHLAARLLQHRGRGIAGVVVQTLFAAAIEILERAGTSQRLDDTLFPILVQQAAAREPALQESLGTLADGYASVTATVADLLDAGFTPLHEDAVIEPIHASEHSAATRARAEAVVRVATRVLAASEQWGVVRTSMLLQSARDALAEAPAQYLPTRDLLVHGFADATGVAADLIESLVHSFSGEVYLDHPADPADATTTDAGIVFTDRLRSRFGAEATRAVGLSAEPTPHASTGSAPITFLRAPGVHAEVRAVANRLRLLLDSGVAPEGIAVVARDLSPYISPLRTHLVRLGIPYSGLSARAPLDGVGRRVGAVLALLQQGPRAPIERWLDASARLGSLDLGAMQRADLRVALRSHGAARLGEATALDAAATLDGRKCLPLPVRTGLRAGDSSDHDPVAERRGLDAALWRAAISAAQRFLVAWQQWPQHTSVHEHMAHIYTLLASELGWPDGVEPLTSLSQLREALPDGIILQRDEILTLLVQQSAQVGRAALGGAGAGVQILSVVEARARTWQHLFVLGLNRDSFPRIIHEDPLFPDRLRRALVTVLPDMPVKEAGHDEERFLFAQLLSASPNRTLSWQFVDEEGKPRITSTLVERLISAHPDLPVTTVPSLYDEAPGGPTSGDEPQTAGDIPQITFGFMEKRGHRSPVPTPAIRPAHEHAILTALHGNRMAFGAVLPLALAEVEGDHIDTRALAQARLAVLNEMDPDRRTAAPPLGPYFGFVGRVQSPADARRRRRLYVTTIERIARCPWQTFLLRLLGLEQAPDPLASLPGISPLMLGNTVHRVLEVISKRALGERDRDLTTVAQQATTPIPWPSAVDLEAELRAAASKVLRDEGIGLPGFVHVLVERARPYLQAAQTFEWREGLPAVLAAETEGCVRLESGVEVWFRADRVDRIDGALHLTDYKTGRDFLDVKTADARQQKLLAKVASAEALQAAAYALAARQLGTGGVGRYSFLRPDIEEYGREAALASDAVGIVETFTSAVETVLGAWDAGSFFPRLVDANKDTEPISCTYCDVATACLRGDSASRQRLRTWTGGADESALQGAERSLLGVWQIGLKGAEKTSSDDD